MFFPLPGLYVFRLVSCRHFGGCEQSFNFHTFSIWTSWVGFSSDRVLWIAFETDWKWEDSTQKWSLWRFYALMNYLFF